MNATLGTSLSETTKRSPAWAIGLVSIVISVALSFIGIYTIARSEVQQYLQGSQKIQETQFSAQNEIYKAVIGIVNNNSNQITTLSSALQTTQEQNKSLGERVAAIEKDLNISQVTLKDCQEALTVCGKRSK